MVIRAMGQAIIQCQIHSDQEIRGACRCVTVKVIRPVAVSAVSNCSFNIQVYSSEMGLHTKKIGRVKILTSYYVQGPERFCSGQMGPTEKKNCRTKI